MPVVQMPDGALVELPDNPTPEQKEAVRLKVEGMQGGSNVARQAKLTGSSILQGLAGLPALALDAAEATQALFSLPGRAIAERVTGDKIPSDFTPLRSTQGVVGGAEELFGVKPQTSGEKWRHALVSGAAGGLSGPGAAAAPLRSAFAGASGGGGAEAAARLFGDNALVRILGGLVGGGAGAVTANTLAGVSPRVRELAQEAARGLDDATLSKAEAFMKASKAQGVDVDLAQALEAIGSPSANVTAIRNILAGSKSGPKVQETLAGQPSQLKATADLTMLSTPGTARQPTTVANTVAEASTDVVNAAKRARTAAVRGDYDAAGELPRNVRQQFRDAIMETITAPGAGEDVVAAGNRALAKLDQAPSTQAAMSHALDYDTLISDLTGPFKGTPLSPANPKAQGVIKSLGAKLNQILQGASPELKAAEAKFAQISQDVVDPLKQSVVGQMATKSGYKADTQASAAKLESLFAAGVDPAARGRSDILTLAKELNNVDKTAFPDAAKTFISGRISKSFEPELNGQPGSSVDAAEKIWNGLFATQKQWQGMRDMAAGIADAHGMPRGEVVRGLENLAQIVKAVKSRPSSSAGLEGKEIKELAGTNYASNAARVFGFLPFEKVARKIEDAALAKTFGRFDELLTTPEGARLLGQLGKQKPLSEESLVLLSGFSGAAPNTQSQR